MKREKIDIYVDVYINFVSLQEKGWPKESMLSKFMSYRGTFQDSQKVVGLEKYADQIQKEHRLFKSINAAIKRLDPPVALSILAKRYLRGLNEKTDRTYTNKDRAYLIKQKPRQFENNLARAYRKLSDLLEMLEEV